MDKSRQWGKSSWHETSQGWLVHTVCVEGNHHGRHQGDHHSSQQGNHHSSSAETAFQSVIAKLCLEKFETSSHDQLIDYSCERQDNNTCVAALNASGQQSCIVQSHMLQCIGVTCHSMSAFLPSFLLRCPFLEGVSVASIMFSHSCLLRWAIAHPGEFGCL